jgi:hypothetical protein
LKAKNTINGCRNTDYNGLGNDPYNAWMLCGILQCWTLYMQHQWTMFYVPQSISTRHFKDLNTPIKWNCVWIGIRIK